jgi:hypothetical protein
VSGRHVDDFAADVTLGTPVAIAVDTGDYNAFPGITTCANGDLLIAWRLGSGHTGSGVVTTRRSTDNGATWATAVSTVETIAGSATLSTLSDGRVVMAGWRNTTPQVPYIRFSSDHGVTFGDSSTLTHDLADQCIIEGPVVEFGGELLVAVWGKRSGETDRTVQVLTSTDDGATFGSPVTIADPLLYPGEDFNETGLLALPDRCVATIREGLWYAHKYRQRGWSAPHAYAMRAWDGAPKTYYWPDQALGATILRGGSIGADGDFSGDGWLLLTQTGWRWRHVAKLHDGTDDGRSMYGQACRIDADTLGLVYSIEIGDPSNGRADLYFRTATVTIT